MSKSRAKEDKPIVEHQLLIPDPAHMLWTLSANHLLIGKYVGGLGRNAWLLTIVNERNNQRSPACEGYAFAIRSDNTILLSSRRGVYIWDTKPTPSKKSFKQQTKEADKSFNTLTFSFAALLSDTCAVICDEKDRVCQLDFSSPHFIKKADYHGLSSVKYLKALNKTQRVLGMNADGNCAVWDKTNQLEIEFKVPPKHLPSPIENCSISEDEQLFAVIDQANSRVNIYSLTDGKQVNYLETNKVTTVTFLKHGLATGHDDGSVRLWTIGADSVCITTLDTGLSSIFSLLERNGYLYYGANEGGFRLTLPLDYFFAKKLTQLQLILQSTLSSPIINIIDSYLAAPPTYQCKIPASLKEKAWGFFSNSSSVRLTSVNAVTRLAR